MTSVRRLLETLQVLMAGHNAIRFDLPVLLAECHRHCLETHCFERWFFADTLHIFQGGHSTCCKLQCLVKDLYAPTVNAPTELKAHRALDDCTALRRVVESAAHRLGMSLPTLLEKFALQLDMPSSLAQLAVLMD